MQIRLRRIGTEFAHFHPRRATIVLYGAAALFVIGLHLATSGNLGFHTDELYYLTCGQHPSLGYVDFPPLVPLLARVETTLLGVTPWTLRLLPCLLSGVLVALCGAYVRRLGGSLRLQAIGLVTGIAAPYLLSPNWVFQTVTFDQVTEMVALYWFLCLVVNPRPRYWIYLGITLGIGLEVKNTIVALIAGIVLAVLLTPRLRIALRTRSPWIGAALALLIWAPNLGWQLANGFPTLTYVSNHSGGAVANGIGTYFLLFAVSLFFLIPLWAAGMVWLVRSPTLRPIAIACAVPLVVFLFDGKSYYAAPTYAIVIAAGLMALSRLDRSRLRRSLEIAVVVACALEFVLLLSFTTPITPPDRLHATGLDVSNEVFADSVGWADIPRQVTSIYDGLPRADRTNAVIISAYYGVPGAIQFLGNPSALPPVVSPQLSDWYWLPAGLRASEALMIDYQPSDVTWMCTSARLIAHLTVPFQVHGLEQGAPVTLCQLRAPVSAVWPRLRNFS